MVEVDFEWPFSTIVAIRNTGEEGGSTQIVTSNIFDSILV